MSRKPLILTIIHGSRTIESVFQKGHGIVTFKVLESLFCVVYRFAVNYKIKNQTSNFFILEGPDVTIMQVCMVLFFI